MRDLDHPVLVGAENTDKTYFYELGADRSSLGSCCVNGCNPTSVSVKQVRG
jgi:hypothetical protein